MDNPLKSQYHIVLGALFHDIGKFKQRAFGGKPHSKFPQSMDSMILPSTHSGYGYQHALWTFDFFENDLKNLQLPNDLDWNIIRNLASKHHNPSTFEEEILQKADRLSSSIDRTESDNHFKSGDYLKKHLRSIFTQVSIENELMKNVYGYNIATLDIANTFPILLQDETGSLQEKYAKLWDDFVNLYKKMCMQWGKNSSIHHFLHSTMYLLKKFTWSIPAATNDKFCDSLLYDHAVSTAAIALSLLHYCTNRKMPADDEKVFLLFAADISGIQQFIFQRHHQVFKGSSKIIRGRSFFISSIGLAYQYLLYKKLNIIPFTQLLSSSGKFYLLLPNTPQVTQIINEVVEQVDRWLFKEFHGDFSIVTDYSTVASINDLSNNFADLIGSVNYNLSVAKFNKFKTILQKGECVIDVDYSEEEICPSCGKYTKEKRFADEEGERCGFCNTMFDLGAKVVKNSLYIIIQENKSGDVNFFDNKISIVFANDVLPYNDALVLFTLDASKADTCMQWEFNNYVPIANNELKTFEEIAQDSVVYYNGDEEGVKRGVPLLSFIKLDVDNLGFIFSHGIQNLSVARYVTVSRMINYYFNSIVYSILHEKFKSVYTVLSGGDDLFVVSPFRDTIPLIKEIYNQFKKFTCNNPDIHFSTGIFVCHANYPMSKAAEMAEEELEKAKNNSELKNKVCYFTVMEYEKNLFAITDYVKWFEQKFLQKDSPVSQAFIYRLLKYTRQSYSNTFEKYLYIPKFKYDLARNIIKKDNGKIMNAEEVTWIEEFFENNVAKKSAWVEAVIMTAIYFMRKYQEKSKEVKIV
jgi:CRISPR-associated protein Csm1